MILKVFCVLIVAVVACKHTTAQLPYNLDRPDKQYTLPQILNEVSGITDLDSNHLALVQDEIGMIFVFDLPSGNIIHQFPFDSIGDFEGITFTGTSLFILRSDGRLTEWKNFTLNAGGKEIIHHNLPILTKDNEGLCYDKQNQRLLIAAKSKPEDSAAKSERYIYSFDLLTFNMSDKPLYSINVEDLAAKAKQSGATAPNVKSKGKSKSANFRPSSLAIHPVTKEIYILSGADQLIVVLDTNGIISEIESLNKNLFPKAEGLTFLDDGTMIISNEADGKVATVLKYRMQILD